MKGLTDAAEARRASGEGTRTDVTILEAQRVELEVEIGAAELRRREARIRLARLLGEPSSGAAWTLEVWTAPDRLAESEATWIETALAARPEIQSIAWELSALGDDDAAAHLLPWEGAGAGVEAQRSEDGDWFVGPSVSTPLPVFDTGQARRARLTAEQIEARHNLTLARRRVAGEVRIAYESLDAGRINLDRIKNDLIPLQHQRRQVVEDVYSVERDITPLLLAEQDLRTAQAKQIDAELQASVALIRLQRAVGGRAVAGRIGTPPSTHGPATDQPSPDSRRSAR
jgi:cobalt-zinc-cadmium efflux system outer membrane protein